MRQLINPLEEESVLAQWSGARAKIWLFHVSHGRMVINLSRKGLLESLYIVAVGCERISGPFSWSQASIAVLTAQPNQQGEVWRRVVDEKAGFELLCRGVSVSRGPLEAPDNP